VFEIVATLVFRELVKDPAAEVREFVDGSFAPSRSSFLNLEKASSIGFRSGEYGGR